LSQLPLYSVQCEVLKLTMMFFLRLVNAVRDVGTMVTKNPKQEEWKRLMSDKEFGDCCYDHFVFDSAKMFDLALIYGDFTAAKYGDPHASFSDAATSNNQLLALIFKTVFECKPLYEQDMLDALKIFGKVNCISRVQLLGTELLTWSLSCSCSLKSLTISCPRPSSQSQSCASCSNRFWKSHVD